MADPKYVNLPGIAHDQPDTYESPDLPESDQFIHGDFRGDDELETDSGNPAIDHPTISVESAFEKFRSARINGERVDFSDGGHGYDSDGKYFQETLAQKIVRLKREVSEVIAEFEGVGTGAGGLNSGQEIQELHQLQKQIGNLFSGGRASSNQSNPGGQLLKAKLEASDSSAAGTQGVIQYELHVERKANTAASSASVGQKAMELESRITRLEHVLGTGRDSLVTLGFQNPRNSSILGALTVLHSKLCLWEPGNIEIIETKLAGVLQKVNQLIEKKVDVQELERTLKLSSLYDLLESSSSTIEVLPELSQRLETIKDLHSAAGSAVREIHDLKSSQEWMATGLTQNEQLLKELKSILVGAVGTNQ